MNTINGNVIDGWQQVHTSGEFYWDFFDEGNFIIRCKRSARDEILEKSGLPLKLVDSGIYGILTDF